MYLVLSNLGAGISLTNKSGLTGSYAPLNRPYVLADLPGEGLVLAPGAALSFTLQFINPSRFPISYALDVVTSSQTP